MAENVIMETVQLIIKVMAHNRIPRKLKKRIILCFGRGTYRGIRDGHLKLAKLYNNNRGVITKHIYPIDVTNFYFAGQHTPHLTFPNINLRY